MIDVTDIEKRIDHAKAGPTPVNADFGGLALENLGQVMEFAKLMSVSGAAVPKYLRTNPGACLAICTRALRWRMDPFAVAEKSYMVNNRGEERVAFEAQLIHAVVIANAPLKERLRDEIVGDGDQRRCTVSGTFKGETKPHIYTSETLAKKIKDIGYNDKGQLKGSPLWITEPEVQLRYSAVRQWCRLYSPDTLLGVYAAEEMEDAVPIDVTDRVADLSKRLKDAKASHVGERGFDPKHIANVIEGDTVKETDDDQATRRDKSGSDGDGQRDRDASQRRGKEQAAGDATGGSDQAGHGQPAKHAPTSAKSQGHAAGKPQKVEPKGKARR